MSKGKRICRQCSGSGRVSTEYVREVSCFYCDGGTVREWESTGGKTLANSDVESDPVCVSNIRVWQDRYSETEGELWRTRTGGYGSTWIEVRPEINEIVADPRHPARRRAVRLGLTGLTGVIEALDALEQYPILDDDPRAHLGSHAVTLKGKGHEKLFFGGFEWGAAHRTRPR